MLTSSHAFLRQTSAPFTICIILCQGCAAEAPGSKDQRLKWGHCLWEFHGTTMKRYETSPPFESTSLLTVITSRKCHATARRRKMMRIFHLLSMALVTLVEDGHWEWISLRRDTSWIFMNSYFILHVAVATNIEPLYKRIGWPFGWPWWNAWWAWLGWLEGHLYRTAKGTCQADPRLKIEDWMSSTSLWTWPANIGRRKYWCLVFVRPHWSSKLRYRPWLHTTFHVWRSTDLPSVRSCVAPHCSILQLLVRYERLAMIGLSNHMQVRKWYYISI